MNKEEQNETLRALCATDLFFNQVNNTTLFCQYIQNETNSVNNKIMDDSNLYSTWLDNIKVEILSSIKEKKKKIKLKKLKLNSNNHKINQQVLKLKQLSGNIFSLFKNGNLGDKQRIKRIIKDNNEYYQLFDLEKKSPCPQQFSLIENKMSIIKEKPSIEEESKMFSDNSLNNHNNNNNDQNLSFNENNNPKREHISLIGPKFDFLKAKIPPIIPFNPNPDIYNNSYNQSTPKPNKLQICINSINNNHLFDNPLIPKPPSLYSDAAQNVNAQQNNHNLIHNISNLSNIPSISLTNYNHNNANNSIQNRPTVLNIPSFSLSAKLNNNNNNIVQNKKNHGGNIIKSISDYIINNTSINNNNKVTHPINNSSVENLCNQINQISISCQKQNTKIIPFLHIKTPNFIPKTVSKFKVNQINESNDTLFNKQNNNIYNNNTSINESKKVIPFELATPSFGFKINPKLVELTTEGKQKNNNIQIEEGEEKKGIHFQENLSINIINPNQNISEEVEEEYDISDNSISSQEEVDSYIQSTFKKCPSWAKDKNYIYTRILEQSKNIKEISKTFGQCKIDHLDLSMIFEIHKPEYDVRESTADWRLDNTLKNNLTRTQIIEEKEENSSQNDSSIFTNTQRHLQF